MNFEATRNKKVEAQFLKQRANANFAKAQVSRLTFFHQSG